MVAKSAEPQSPCTSVCRLDQAQVCRGCGRHIDEIIEWFSADADRKREIIAAARRRLGASTRGPEGSP